MILDFLRSRTICGNLALVASFGLWFFKFLLLKVLPEAGGRFNFQLTFGHSRYGNYWAFLARQQAPWGP
jgi:hypothetical protein